VYFAQYFPCVVETTEERAMPPLFLGRKQLVLACDVAGVACKTIRAEHFTPDRSDELSIPIIPAETKETEKPVLRLFGRNYCCH
jgi:hypothetical protein